MWLRCCHRFYCCCCCLNFKIQPLSHLIDLQSAGDNQTDSSVATGKNECTFDSIVTTNEGDTGVSSLDSNLYHADQEGEITPIHAAAVTGEKALLSKLLAANAMSLDTGDKAGRTALMYCVLGERLECAELLLKAGADVNKKDLMGRSVLHWAALKGNATYVKLLLGKGADWKDKDHDGQTALHLSTRHKSSRCLALLLKQLQPGAVDDQDNSKRTALHLAALNGNLDQLKLLIRQDSNISIPDIEGKTPLHWAASSRDSQAVDCVELILWPRTGPFVGVYFYWRKCSKKPPSAHTLCMPAASYGKRTQPGRVRLVEASPSVINWQDYEGCTALHLAVACGNDAVVRALVALDKCNVTALDNVFRTPLHWATVLGHTSIAAMLLDNRAEYSSSDSNGATPLHYAAQNNHASTVDMFLSYRGVRDEVDIEGRTAFLWAACRGANDVITVFILHSVDLLQADKSGATALHLAAMAGHASSVQLLLDSGTPIDVADNTKHTALFRACEMGRVDVVQTLMDHGALIDIRDLDGRSPLHWAALGGHACICQMLIKFGVDPNVQDLSGRTPLHCAAYGGYVNCMSALVEHKADTNLYDREGMTSLHWACSKGYLDAVKLLIKHHAYPNHMEATEDRYTALDYALMGEHFEVCQYMIEQGAVSITAIRDLAALKIQAWFRGYQVHKTFLEQKKLLMKHEQLRKDATKKKAVEEIRRRRGDSARTSEQQESLDAQNTVSDERVVNEKKEDDYENTSSALDSLPLHTDVTNFSTDVSSIADDTRTVAGTVSGKMPLSDSVDAVNKDVRLTNETTVFVMPPIGANTLLTDDTNRAIAAALEVQYIVSSGIGLYSPDDYKNSGVDQLHNSCIALTESTKCLDIGSLQLESGSNHSHSDRQNVCDAMLLPFQTSDTSKDCDSLSKISCCDSPGINNKHSIEIDIASTGDSLIPSSSFCRPTKQFRNSDFDIIESVTTHDALMSSQHIVNGLNGLHLAANLSCTASNVLQNASNITEIVNVQTRTEVISSSSDVETSLLNLCTTTAL